jgi:hypothetical protein
MCRSLCSLTRRPTQSKNCAATSASIALYVRAVYARFMRVEQELHSSISQCTMLLVGSMRSPVILPACASLPIQSSFKEPGVGGMISAMGLPNRVTRIGRPVLRTRSSVARQVALNFEIGIESMRRAYYGQ